MQEGTGAGGEAEAIRQKARDRVGTWPGPPLHTALGSALTDHQHPEVLPSQLAPLLIPGFPCKSGLSVVYRVKRGVLEEQDLAFTLLSGCLPSATS